jgi:hypothetical protein
VRIARSEAHGVGQNPAPGVGLGMPDTITTNQCQNSIGWESHCPDCGAEYRNIQHPLKPLGVTMMRVCDCEYDSHTTTVGSNSTTIITTEER